MADMTTITDHYDDLEIGVVLHDPDTADIVYVNEFATHLYGYSEEELLGMQVSDFSSETFSQEEAVQLVQAAAAGDSQKFEWQNKKPTGELYWVEVKLSPIEINDTQYVVALVSDITEYKMSLYHLRVLVRITRHNLRNKLTVIDGLFDQLHPTDQSLDHDIGNRIRRSIDELLNLTESISEFNSIAATTDSAHPLDISSIVTDIAGQFQDNYPTIAWQIECEDVWALGTTEIGTAIEELLENAVTHNPHDGLEITAAVTENPETEQVRIRISDTGIPIPEAEVEPIVGSYDPDPLSHGNEIGLWEVQTIVSACGGRISIEENTPERKVIEIVLPRAKPRATHA